MALYGAKRRTIKKVDTQFNGQIIPVETSSPVPLRPIEFKNAKADSVDNDLIIKALSYMTDTPIEVSRLPSIGVERTVPSPLFLGKPGEPSDEFLYNNPEFIIGSSEFFNNYDTDCSTHFLFANIQSKTNSGPIGIPKTNFKEFDIPNSPTNVLPKKREGNFEVTFIEQSSDFSEIKISGQNIIMRGKEGKIQFLSENDYSYDNWYNGNFNDYELGDNVSYGYTNDPIISRNIGERYNWSHGTIWFVASIGNSDPKDFNCPAANCDDNDPTLPNCSDNIILPACPTGYLCPPSIGSEVSVTVDGNVPLNATIINLPVPSISNDDPFANTFEDEDSIYYYSCDTGNDLCVICDDGNLDCTGCDEDKNSLCQPKCPDCCDDNECAECGVFVYYLNADYILDDNASFGVGNINCATLDNNNFTNDIVDMSSYVTSVNGGPITLQIEKFKECDPFKFNLCNTQLFLAQLEQTDTNLDYNCNKRKVDVITTETTASTSSGSLEQQCEIRTSNGYLVDFALVVSAYDYDNKEKVLKVSSIKFGENNTQFVWKNSPHTYKVYIAYNQNGILDNLQLNQEVNNFGSTKFIDVTDMSLKIRKLGQVENCTNVLGVPCNNLEFNVNCLNGCKDSLQDIYEIALPDLGDCAIVKTDNLLSNVPNYYSYEFVDSQYIIKNAYGDVVEIVYDNILTVKQGNVDFKGSLISNIGSDISSILEWKLYKITSNTDSNNLLETTLLETSKGSLFEYDFSGTVNESFELVVSYLDESSECVNTASKIIRIDYVYENYSEIDVSIECDFLRIPEQRSEEEEQNYINYMTQYENSVAYGTYKDLVSDDTHIKTDYSTCAYGNSLILSEELGDVVRLDTDVIMYSNIDGRLGQAITYFVDGNFHYGLEYNLSSGQHTIYVMSINGCQISVDTISIEIKQLDDICDIAWNALEEPSQIKELWSEISYEYLPSEIKLSTLNNIPVDIGRTECYRYNNQRWAEKNGGTYGSTFNDTKFVNVNGRVNAIFVLNAIKSGRCITFTKGEFDKESIKIHVDFLKDPDNPCCDCSPSQDLAAECDNDCPVDGTWKTTGRYEDDCLCDGCDPGNPNPPNIDANEFVTKTTQPILQPEFPGQWIRQIKPDDFTNDKAVEQDNVAFDKAQQDQEAVGNKQNQNDNAEDKG